MEQDPKTAVKAETLTQAHQAVIVSTLMIGAFFVGISMMFAMTSVRTIKPTPVIDPIELTKPMLVQDVEFAQLLASGNTYFQFDLQGYTGSTTDPVNFGLVHYVYFEDSDQATKTLPLFIETNRAHYSTIITLDTPQGVKTICLPDKTADATDEDDMGNTERLYKYFIDANGDSYYDVALKQSTGTNCKGVTSRALNPYPILSGEVYSGEPYYAYIMRDSYAQLGIQGSTVVMTDKWPMPIEESLTPIEMYYMAPQDSEDTFVQNQGVINIQWQNQDPTGYPYLGANICAPALTISPESGVNRMFYDKQGYPYNDVFLTDRVACTFPTPTCSDTDGMNEFTKGVVSGIDYVGREYSESDYCVDTRVIELSCNEYDSLSATLISCANGCANGACLANTDVVYDDIE